MAISVDLDREHDHGVDDRGLSVLLCKWVWWDRASWGWVVFHSGPTAYRGPSSTALVDSQTRWEWMGSARVQAV